MAMNTRDAKLASISSLRSGIFWMLVLGGSVGLSGCTTDNHRQSSDELREKTAETTAEVKRDAKSMAEGVKEGWSRDKERIDLNRATREQLVGAGLTRAQSDHVIEHRPYASTHELLTKHVLSEDEYREVEPHLRAGEPSDSKLGPRE